MVLPGFGTDSSHLIITSHHKVFTFQLTSSCVHPLETESTLFFNGSTSQSQFPPFKSYASFTITPTDVTILNDVPTLVWTHPRQNGRLGGPGCFFSFPDIPLDTLGSSPPENKAMKRATLVGISTTSLFYILCGCVGYAAFGNNAPGNFLTGFGFYEPFWLIDFANVCIAVHLVGAYQVFCQPVYGFVEKWCRTKWPESNFITTEHVINLPLNGEYQLNYFRLIWRTAYVIVTAVIAMIFPFFNDFLGLLGAASFWPLTVYFPVEMYMARTKLPKYSFTWVWLKILSWACLVISLIAAAGSLQGLVQDVKTYRPFKTQE